MENDKNDKKAIMTLLIGIGVLLVLIFSATFAYFSVTSRNNFGTKTITGTADATGSVVLNGTSTSLRLNLTGTDMMKGEDDITYWATSDGTPSTTQNVVTIGSTQVTGAGYYNCDYTLSVTGTGTNNMYTAFQEMSGKSTEQIVLKIGDTKYDFNTANLFPITINGTLNGVTGSNVKSLTAEFYIVNKETVVQDALAGKDLNITITATNFSCTAVEDPNNYLDKNLLSYYTQSFHDEIINIEFLDTVNVPVTTGGADVYSRAYDVSEKQNGSIMLSVDFPEDNEVTFYVGQNGGVLAPPDSSNMFVDLTPYNVGYINFEKFDTSHVVNMSGMFAGAYNENGINLDLSHFNVSNVTNMSGMFSGIPITTLNIAGWNTVNVTNMSEMFYGCRALNNLDLSNFDTSHVTNMDSMFESYLGQSLNLTGWDTSNVINMFQMFYDNPNITSLDLSSFNTANVVNMGEMFGLSSNLETIYVSNNFVTTSLTNKNNENMFLGCDSLVGGSGTSYESAGGDTDTFARIDNPPNYPGYFTLKTN